MGDRKVARTFEYDGVDYELIEPSAKTIREARLKYSIAFTNGIKQGLYVRKSLEKKLREADEEIFSEYIKLRSDTRFQTKLKNTGPILVRFRFF